jgi:predicted PurR-regulated permease PerM
MTLTLNQFLFLVITIAIVVAVTYLVLLLRQLRNTAREGENTLVEINSLVRSLQDTSAGINNRIDDLGGVLDQSKKTAASLAEMATLLTMRIIRPSAKYWPVLYPLFRLSWRLLKRRKEEKNGK